MKIKKTLFSTEIETTPQELEQFIYQTRTSTSIGLFRWIKKNFGLDILPKPKTK